MRIHPSFTQAVTAANISLEAFKTVCAQPEFDVKIKKYGNKGDSLVTNLIENINDHHLPAFLNCMLMREPGFFKKQDAFVCLTEAARLQKENTFRFLLAQGAPLENDETSVLIEIVKYMPKNALSIIKNLENYPIKMNAKNIYGKTALWYAVEHMNAEIIQYLLSKEAQLPLSHEYQQEEVWTVLSLAWSQYAETLQSRYPHENSIKKAENCLNLLLKAAEEMFYATGLKSDTEEEWLLCTLAGNFQGARGANHHSLKNILKSDASQPAKMRLEKEQRFAFFAGSTTHDIPTNPLKTAYLKHPKSEINTTRIIFSFLGHRGFFSHEINSKTSLSSSTSLKMGPRK